MLLNTALFGGMTGLLRIILWIMLPVSAFTVLTVVLIHYGRKWRKTDADDDASAAIAGSSPENFCYNTDDGKLVYLDHTGLLRQLTKKLAYSNARYAALSHDFKKLKSSGTSPLSDKKNENNKNNIPFMEYNNTTMPPHLQADEERVAPAGNDPLHENAYLNDLLEERNRQIEFLQKQIDLRVKNHHYSEQEKSGVKIKLQEAGQAAARATEELESVKNLLSQQKEELERVQAFAGECENELAAARQALDLKQNHVVYIESLLQEMKEQNQVLNAALADSGDRNKELEQQLLIRESKLVAMEQRLLTNKQLLQRLYSEFGACLEEERQTTPVVTLKPDYTDNGWEETALS